jgi:hypothetical protein
MQSSPKPNPVVNPQETQAEPESADQQVGLTGAGQAEAPKPERRKRYYSPSEVRKKKGCIGCGGAGVIAILAAALIIVLALI